MDRALVDRIARSVLYEGYMLYPYRTSSVKNAKRWTFGTLYPESVPVTNRRAGCHPVPHSEGPVVNLQPDRSRFQAEILHAGPPTAPISILARFLLEGVETEVHFQSTIGEARRQAFATGEIGFASTPVAADTFKLTITLRNTSGTAELASAHAVISVSEGELVSVTDPPATLAAAAAECVNEGVWPVLIGLPGARDAMLASPIILPDYPEVAPESAGDLCDSTEIEEILTLRILTLTDEEKADVRASGSHVSEILERSESLPAEHLMKLHGTIRGLAPSGNEPWSVWDTWANRAVAQTVQVGGVCLKTGDRVRLRPSAGQAPPAANSGSRRADIFDTALNGRTAIIAGIEEDFENKVQVAVVVEDDPGRDLGEMRQTGHRFFFSPEEIELP
jgi:hypothetical protein